MRLTALTLNKYGCFEDERIVFDPRPGVLNLLIAPNGAGKSVLRTAFGDLLFGIHNQTPMGFRYGYPGMRIAADIAQPGGSIVSIGRRKARGNALTAADGSELDPAVAGALLGTRDRSLLERLFALDTHRLREGGKALLASGGDLASALLSASGGIREARHLLRALERERDDLAPVRRASQRPYYRALDNYTDARRRIAAAQLKPDERHAQQTRLDELERQQHEHNRRVEAASAEISRLERIRRVRPLLAERDEAAAWLDANPGAPNLGSGLRERLGDAHLAFVKAETEANTKAQALAEVEAQAAAIVLDTALLAEAAAIDSLIAEAGAARKAAADRPVVAGELEAKSGRIGDLLRQLGSDLPPARAAEAIPQRTVQARTQRLIRDHAEQMAATRDAPAKLAARTHDLAEIDRKLSALPAGRDLRGLEALVREVGDPAARQEEAARAHAETAAALAAMLARVPGWRGDATALAETKPLTEDLYARHDADVRAATSEEIRARDLHAAEDQKLQAARVNLAEIARSGSVPDAEALQRARARREAVWRLIYRHAFTADKPAPEEEQAVTDGAPLPLAFERAMAAADALADQRTEHSGLLARIEAAKRAVELQETLVSQAEDRLRVAQQKADAARRAWMQLCAPLPIGAAAALPDVQTFVAARERVLDALARHAVTTGGLETLAAKHAAWAARLALVLPPPHGDLADLLSRARQAVDEGNKREKARERLETQRMQADKELRETAAAAAEADRQLDAWRADWKALLAELRRPAGEDPAVTEQVLQLLNDIDKEHLAAAALSRRISGMQADIDRFGQSVREVAARVAETDREADPFDIARNLAKRVDEQKKLLDRRNTLIARRDAARLAAEKAAARLADCRAALHAILLQIGVDTIEAAQARLTLGEQRARFEAQRHGADTKLLDAGDAIPPGQLRDEVADVPPDELQFRLDVLNDDRRAAGDAAQAALRALTELSIGMAQQEADTNINAAAADRQAAVACVANTLDEALLLHTAASMLELALKSVEDSGDSGLLQRIGAIFQALTLGAYARVTTETDGDSAARLVLVQQAYPEERQAVDQLSEGTRDQLFLALRVAEIERHLTAATPLPFIGDDILQTFDDDRALAAMRVLTDLSHRTQIILLTHHRHVVDLSARLPAGSVHVCEREAAVSAG